MLDHLGPLIAAGTISAPVAAGYGFDQVREAITKAARSGGMVLSTPKARLASKSISVVRAADSTQAMEVST